MAIKLLEPGAFIEGVVPTALVDYMEKHALPWEEAAARAGLSPIPLDASRYYPFEAVCAFAEECALASGDDSLGLKAGYYAPIGAGNFADYLSVTAATVEEGLRNWVRFEKLTTNAMSTSHSYEGDYLRQRTEILVFGGRRTQFLDLVFGYDCSRLREMTQDPELSYKVELSQSEPENRADFEELLGPDVTYDCEFDQIFIPRECLAKVPPRHDPVLMRIIEDAAFSAMESLHYQGDDLIRITNQICNCLKSGDASLDNVARQLGMSKRSLQRTLSDADTTYRKLVEDIRRTLAERYLSENDLQISEVAYLLGYSEISAFSRAVKLWFGSSPRAVRNRRSLRPGTC